MSVFFFFFFQAEDGIRDHCVTGVQTCALPIFNRRSNRGRCTPDPVTWLLNTSDVSDKPLTAGANQPWKIIQALEILQAMHVLEQRQILGLILGEADSWIKNYAPTPNSCLFCSFDSVNQLTPNAGDDTIGVTC